MTCTHDGPNLKAFVNRFKRRVYSRLRRQCKLELLTRRVWMSEIKVAPYCVWLIHLLWAVRTEDYPHRRVYLDWRLPLPVGLSWPACTLSKSNYGYIARPRSLSRNGNKPAFFSSQGLDEEATRPCSFIDKNVNKRQTVLGNIFVSRTPSPWPSSFFFEHCPCILLLQLWLGLYLELFRSLSCMIPFERSKLKCARDRV